MFTQFFVNLGLTDFVLQEILRRLGRFRPNSCGEQPAVSPVGVAADQSIYHRNPRPFSPADRLHEVGLRQPDYERTYFRNDGRGVENGVNDQTYFWKLESHVLPPENHTRNMSLGGFIISKDEKLSRTLSQLLQDITDRILLLHCSLYLKWITEISYVRHLYFNELLGYLVWHPVTTAVSFAFAVDGNLH